MTLLEPGLRALERGRRAIVQAKRKGQKHTFGRGPGYAVADSSILFDYQAQAIRDQPELDGRQHDA